MTAPDAGVAAVVDIRRYIEAMAVTAKSLGQDDRNWLDLLVLVDKATPLVVAERDRAVAEFADDVEALADEYQAAADLDPYDELSASGVAAKLHDLIETRTAAAERGAAQPPTADVPVIAKAALWSALAEVWEDEPSAAEWELAGVMASRAIEFFDAVMPRAALAQSPVPLTDTAEAVAGDE